MHTSPARSASTPQQGGAVLAHDTLHEGIALGTIVAITTWLWVAGWDIAAGTPMRTFSVLGGAALFTLVHVALCLTYGIAIVAAVHAATRTPSVVFAMIFLTILFQAAFAMLTAFVANLGVGNFAWALFFTGNLLAAGVTYAYVQRRHSLRQLFHDAEADLAD